MTDDVYDGDAVIVGLDQATALLLGRVIQAGLDSLRGDLAADETEQLLGFTMFLVDAVAFTIQERQREVSRRVA